MTPQKVWTILLSLVCLLIPAAQAEQPPPLVHADARMLAMSFSPATRLLVVSPHPDDETLGAGGLIQRVLHAGGAVKVVFMTSGDGYPVGVTLARHVQHPQAQDYREYGRLRQEEAKQALAVLGVSTKKVAFLGFPDNGLCPIQMT